MDDKDGDDRVYTSPERGNYKKAIEYHEKRLKVAKEIANLAEEGAIYGNLGNAYNLMGDYQKAINYHEKHLKIAKEIGNLAKEGAAYGDLGEAYQSLSNYSKRH